MTDTVFYLSSDPTNGISLPIKGELTGRSYIDVGKGITKENLVKVEIGTKVKSIDISAFQECRALQSVTIGDSVTKIGKKAFFTCSALQSLTIGDSVTSIGVEAFRDCKALTELTIGDSVTSIGNYAFYYCVRMTTVTIPDSVTSIGNYAFYQCSKLTKLTIGNSVESIGISAFYKCSALTTLTIPNSVETIGDYAFYKCKALTTLTIGKSVRSIGNYVFYECKALTTVTIPDSVTSIGSSAFRNCSGLITVTLPTNDNFKTIGTRAFQECKALTTLTIPDSVTSIGGEAFRNCSGLESVTIGKSVTSIGGEAFLKSGIATVKMSLKPAFKLNLIPNIHQVFFGQKNVYIVCPERSVQPGTISGDYSILNNGYNFDTGSEEVVIRLYVPGKRTYEEDRSRILIADFTNIEKNGGTEIRDIVWDTTTDNGANWTTITDKNERTYTLKTYPETSTQFRVSCKYTPSTKKSSFTSLSANSNRTFPLIGTQKDKDNIEQNVITRNNIFEFEDINNLSVNFNNAEFRKTLTKVYLINRTTISDKGFFKSESKSFLYENMQEVEVGSITKITGTPFPDNTRIYIRSITKYLDPDTYTWVNAVNKNLIFYINNTDDKLAKTREDDGIKASTISGSIMTDNSVNWNTKDVEIEIKTNCYKENKYFQCITDATNGTGQYAWDSTEGDSDHNRINGIYNNLSKIITNTNGNGLIFSNGILGQVKPSKPENFGNKWTFDNSPKDFRRYGINITLTYGDETFTEDLEIKGENWGKGVKTYDNPTTDNSPPSSNGSCFPGNSQLILKDGSKKIFHDIEVGDEIQVCSKDMELSYSKVIFLPHLQNNISSEYIKFTTTSNQTIRATPNHYLPVLNKNNVLENVMAEDITKDDKLYVLNNGQGMPEEIKTIEGVTEEGVYTACVKEGEYIIVDNVVASPFIGDRDDLSYISKYVLSYNMTRIYAKGFAMLDNLGLMYIVAPLYRYTESLVTNILKIFRQ